MEKHVLITLSDTQKFFSTFGNSFSFDTETTSLKFMLLEIEGISFCDGKKSCYIPFTFRSNIWTNPETYWTNPETKDILSFLKPLFEECKGTVVAHNAVYDMKVLYKYGISFDNIKIYDTMIADHLIDETRKHGLKDLSALLLGKDVTKYKELTDSGSQKFIDYAMDDAIFTWELMKYQKPIMKENNLGPLFRDIEMPFQLVLLDMEINGMEIDIPAITKIRGELKEAVSNFSEEMHINLGEKCEFQADLEGNIHMIPTINFNSPLQMKDILINRLGLIPAEHTKKGAPMLGKSFMLKYKYKNEFVAILNKYKIANKLLTSYFSENGQIMSNVDSDNKVRAEIWDTGTVSGRLSVTKPALQTLPKSNEDFPVASRSAFIAGKGNKMFTVDFSNQEGRITAHLSGDKTYIDQLLNGWDAHLSTANAAFSLGIPEECLSSNHPEFKSYVDKFKKERQKAKSINFALPYGGTEFAISKAMGVSKEEAKEAIDKYYTKYSGIKDAMDVAQAEIRNSGTLTNMFGRKRHFKKVENWNGQIDYPDKAFRQAFNFLVQSSSADMMRRALIDTRLLFMANPHWEAKITMTVHDEGCFICKEEHLEEAAGMTKEVFENCIKLRVPIISDIGTGNNYEEAK